MTLPVAAFRSVASGKSFCFSGISLFQSTLVVVLKFLWFEVAGSLIYDMLREPQNIVVYFDVLNIVEILRRVAHLVRKRKSIPIMPLSYGSKAMIHSMFVKVTRATRPCSCCGGFRE